MNRRYRKLPRLVHNLMLLHGAWLIGSGADWYLDKPSPLNVVLSKGERIPPVPQPKDYDLLIPPDRFGDACKHIGHRHVFVNSFGGLKVTVGGVQMDLIPMTIDAFTARADRRGPQSAVRLSPVTVIRWGEDV